MWDKFILNIGPKYHDGMRLKKGSYHLEVSRNGYETVKRWIAFDNDKVVTIQLTKVVQQVLTPISKKYICKGLTKHYVKKIQGNPINSYSGDVWEYLDGSIVYFENNRVTGWSNQGSLILSVDDIEVAQVITPLERESCITSGKRWSWNDSLGQWQCI